ncbi:YbhN family protein [Peptidiphaga sp.]|uniref:lysylphosphatidylglycerol synthase transmembrane domain-containing protein n=1 Tax=Peptidiphaga sp. TaxID=2848648 RepID=UPI003606DA12
MNTTGRPAVGEAKPRRSALLIDEEARWIRHPRDLFSASITALAIGGVMLLAIYASSTTLAVTRDVRTATNEILETILFIPVNVLEGLISFFLPLTVIVDIAWHRRWRALITAAGATVSAVGIAFGLLWFFTKYFPLSPLTGQLSDSLTEQSYIWLLPYVAVISAILTVASSGKKTKTARWGWPLLSIVLVLSVLQGNQTLPGALITAFLGTTCGMLARYILGDLPNHAAGVDLVHLVRRAGIDAKLIVRIDELPEEATLQAWVASARTDLGHVDRYGVEQIRAILKQAGESAENAETGQTAHDDLPYTTTLPLPSPGLIRALDVDANEVRDTVLESYHPPIGEEAARNYVVIDADDVAYHASMLDADRQIVGLLATMWSRIVLTTTARHTEATIEAAKDRFALMELAAVSARLVPDRGLHVAATDNSAVILMRVCGGTALDRLDADGIPDSALDEVWDILRHAHQRGLSHGDVQAGVTALRDGHVELLHWENGSIAASEMERRIDMAQTMAMMAGMVGIDRAVASANRCLSADQVISLAPILQRAVIPAQTRAQFHDRKELESLRDRLTEQVPEVGTITPTQLYRFSPRTVVTVTIGLIAVYLLLGSVNFTDLRETLAQANPLWMLFAFGSALFTYLGAAMTLQAYTAEKLPLRESTIVQVAASVVTLVAPAGIGPAALNLRFLHKRRVPTPIALATVTLVQVAQFATTIIFLIVLSLATGEVGRLTLPSGSVLFGVVLAILVIGALMLITPLRQWVARKTRPTIDQVWPRLVWLTTHPSRILYGFAGSIVQTIAFVTCFGGCLASFGYPLPIVTLALTYLLSNSLGSIIPSPGGIGPVETALTGGLSVAGVPYSIAFSTAILYRLFTFWGRVPLGWLALRYLSKREII